MASGELLTELVRAHMHDDAVRFENVLNQVIAAESRSGHTSVARRLREIRDESQFRPAARAVPIARAPKSLEGVLQVEFTQDRLADLIVSRSIEEHLERVVVEQRQHERLAAHGLAPRRKLLLHGPPGTGKTMTARALAGELGIPLVRVRLEVLFSRYLGETAATLAEIFEEATKRRAVYLFDEFDALGSQRSRGNDVGEMRRIVGTFLQLLDADQSSSIFVAATNSADGLDEALFRRFDDVLEYLGPTADERAELLRRSLRSSRLTKPALLRLVEESKALSLADLTSAVNDARKAAVLSEMKSVTEESARRAIIQHSARRHRSRDIT